jgi:hypothetical protein
MLLINIQISDGIVFKIRHGEQKDLQSIKHKLISKLITHMELITRQIY